MQIKLHKNIQHCDLVPQRLKAQPDTPLVTVEYSLHTHKILQCYGEHDHKPSDDILHYVNKVWLPYANKTIKKLAA